MTVYDLELYYRGYAESEHWYFTRPLSPKQMWGVISKYSRYFDKNIPCPQEMCSEELVDDFSRRVTVLFYVYFGDIELHDYLLEVECA